MATHTPGRRAQKEQAQNDPGVSNDPKSDRGGYDAHMWSSINQIFERLGEVSQKIDRLAADQGELKTSVEKHDKIVMRVVYTFSGVVLVLIALWFLYDNLLKGHVTFTGNGM